MDNEDIRKVFEHIINVLKNNFNHLPKFMPKVRRREFEISIRSRMDEALLIYSELFKVTFVDAKNIFNVDTIYLEEPDNEGE